MFTSQVRIIMALLTTAFLLPRGANAAYKSLQRDGSANTVGAAKVLVAPTRDDHSLLIKRIRITNSAASTNPSYRFFAKSSSDQEGDTASLAACPLPGCIEIADAEAVSEGVPFDLDNLYIRLMPGDRLYFYATADISSESEYATIEVWYSEGPDPDGRKGRKRWRP